MTQRTIWMVLLGAQALLSLIWTIYLRQTGVEWEWSAFFALYTLILWGLIAKMEEPE